jgi:hypothetical protein
MTLALATAERHAYNPIVESVRKSAPRAVAYPAKSDALAREARIVLRQLKGGDWIFHCLKSGWKLARTGAPVSAELVEILRNADNRLPRKLRGAIPKGTLSPLNDGLPGIGESQTWRWSQHRP